MTLPSTTSPNSLKLGYPAFVASPDFTKERFNAQIPLWKECLSSTQTDFYEASFSSDKAISLLAESKFQKHNHQECMDALSSDKTFGPVVFLSADLTSIVDELILVHDGTILRLVHLYQAMETQISMMSISGCTPCRLWSPVYSITYKPRGRRIPP